MFGLFCLLIIIGLFYCIGAELLQRRASEPTKEEKKQFKKDYDEAWAYHLKFKRAEADKEIARMRDEFARARAGEVHKVIDVRVEPQRGIELSPPLSRPEREYHRACKNCGGLNLVPMRKGYSLGKAMCGAVVAGPIGLVAGAHGSGKIQLICTSCGEKQ